MKAIVLVLVGLVLTLGPTRVHVNDDDRSGVCVGSMQIVACVPPDAP